MKVTGSCAKDAALIRQAAHVRMNFFIGNVLKIMCLKLDFFLEIIKLIVRSGEKKCVSGHG